MENKSSKSPSGEDRDQKNKHIRDQEVHRKNTGKNSDVPDADKKVANSESTSNRGYEEDQPNNPVRSTGSTGKEQDNLPTGEPNANEK